MKPRSRQTYSATAVFDRGTPPGVAGAVVEEAVRRGLSAIAETLPVFDLETVTVTPLTRRGRSEVMILLVAVERAETPAHVGRFAGLAPWLN